MTLRRFPWKCPRITDNSYKLFVSAPNDGPRGSVDNRSSAIIEARKEGAASEPASRAPSDAASESSHHHHHHRSRNHNTANSEPPTNETAAGHRGSTTSNSDNAGASSQQQGQQQIIKGPWRLLRLLPRETRHIIGRMLEIDPKKRATMEEIFEDKWVQGSEVCRQEEDRGAVLRGENHNHTLEPGNGESAPPSKK
jgi:serine/threonine protein kinase